MKTKIGFLLMFVFISATNFMFAEENGPYTNYVVKLISLSPDKLNFYYPGYGRVSYELMLEPKPDNYEFSQDSNIDYYENVNLNSRLKIVRHTPNGSKIIMDKPLKACESGYVYDHVQGKLFDSKYEIRLYCIFNDQPYFINPNNEIEIFISDIEEKLDWKKSSIEI